jgi:hypothetical protein
MGRRAWEEIGISLSNFNLRLFLSLSASIIIFPSSSIFDLSSQYLSVFAVQKYTLTDTMNRDRVSSLSCDSGGPYSIGASSTSLMISPLVHVTYI